MFIDKDPSKMLDAVRMGGTDPVNIFQVEFRPSNRAGNLKATGL